jgi:hypothetical protein
MTVMRWIVLVVVALGSSRAHAGSRYTWLDHPRVIPRTWSASRDAPAMALGVLPRDIRTLGGELALFTWRGRATGVRVGFAGLLELESEGETLGVSNLFPQGAGNLLWRGSYAYYAALSLDDAAKQLCATCAIELGLQYRHESQHYTGSNAGGPGRNVEHQPYIGDDLIVDGAISVGIGRWLVAARAVAFVFLPGRSSYAGGPALDIHVRWRTRRVHPFVSMYAEQLFGAELVGRRFPDAYLVRMLAGIALPSTLGDVMVYVSADAGNRKGIVGNTEEATLGTGIRLALGAAR